MQIKISKISVLSVSVVSFFVGFFMFIPLLVVMAILNSFNPGYKLEDPSFFILLLLVCSVTFSLCCTLGTLAYNLISKLGSRFRLMIEVDEK